MRPSNTRASAACLSAAIRSKSRPRCPLRGASGWNGCWTDWSNRASTLAVVDQLGEYLTTGAAQELARIRPLALAERWGVDPDQVVRACLHGAREGLLELHWDLLCPVCRISCQVTDTLRAIAEHAHCEACHLDFQLDFANSIELIFRVHPEIRAADLGTYCIGGPAHAPHVIAQVRVAPGERIELDLELPAGSYRPARSAIALVNRFPGPEFRDDPPLGGRPWFGTTARPARRACAGGQLLILTNAHSSELVVRLERTATRSDALTAARATSMALFRELFPGELLAPGRLATVSMVTLMVTALDPQQADSLYNELGDTRAFSVIHEHLQHLGEAIRPGVGRWSRRWAKGCSRRSTMSRRRSGPHSTCSPRPDGNSHAAGAPPAGRHSPRHDPGGHVQRPTRLLRHNSPAGRGHIAICRRWRAGFDPAGGGRSCRCRFAQCSPHPG